MLRRFASATCVSAPAVGVATVIALLVAQLRTQNIYPLTAFWCILAPVWGLWAMLAPRTWVPQRLPIWGAILGLLAGTMAMFVLDLPARMFQAPPAAPLLRGLLTLILAAVYYLLWMIVRAATRALAGDSRGSS